MLLASDLSNGAFGFGGVVVGGAVSWWLQRADFRNRRQVDADNLVRESATAWELLGFELVNALNAVHDIREKGEWPIGAQRHWTEAWLESREAIIRHPTDAAGLKVVGEVCANLDELQSAVNAQRSKAERKLKASDRLFLNRAQVELESACKALELQPRKVMDPLTDREITELTAKEREEQQNSDN
jgi:hypothetical protein